MKTAISPCLSRGAIVPHVAQRQVGLLPDEVNVRARAVTWMFAALNTMKPPPLEIRHCRDTGRCGLAQ